MDAAKNDSGESLLEGYLEEVERILSSQHKAVIDWQKYSSTMDTFDQVYEEYAGQRRSYFDGRVGKVRVRASEIMNRRD